jgi:hypothetical protein
VPRLHGLDERGRRADAQVVSSYYIESREQAREGGHRLCSRSAAEQKEIDEIRGAGFRASVNALLTEATKLNELAFRWVSDDEGEQ